MRGTHGLTDVMVGS